MKFIYQYLFLALWIGWGIYWRLTWRDVKANVWRESWVSEILHLSALVLTGLLLWLPGTGLLGLSRRLWPVGIAPFWAGAVITATGLVFSIWARIHIGKNWSIAVTLKEGHELITTGPYSLVRHPIYTGLLLGFAGTAVARGDWQGILAVVIAFVSLWLKLRFEERGMRKQFGDVYAAYSRSVAALVPFLL